MAKQLLKNLLNIDGDSQVEIVMTSEQYEVVKKEVQLKVEEPFKVYLDSLKMEEQFAKLNTLAELDAVQVRPFTLEMRQLLADVIDASDLKIHQKAWLFPHFVSAFSSGAMQIIQKALAARYKQIMDSQRIIKPGGGRIITS